ISRNADLEYNEEEADDLLEVIKETIKLRKWGNVIKLEVEKHISSELLEYLMDEFELTKENVFQIDGPLDLRFLHKVSKLQVDESLKFKEIIPLPVPELLSHDDLFQSITHKDALLHHPYDSFSTIVKLVKQ